MPKKFPDWAPTCLIKERSRICSDEHQKNNLDILEKLLTDNRMETVWKAINKRADDESILIEFYFEILSAHRGPSKWAKKTKTKQEAWKKKVITQVSDLNTSLKEHDFFNFGYYLIPLEVKIDIIKNLKLDDEYIKIILEAIDKNVGRKREKINLTLNKETGESESIVMNTDELLTGVLCESLGRFTNTETMLDTLSSHVDNIDTDSNFLKQPSADDAHIIYFMRRLANKNMQCFGQPLYEVVSNTTSVIYDIDISKERARDTVKHVLVEWDKTT
jgi:hypothetical protein